MKFSKLLQEVLIISGLVAMVIGAPEGTITEITFKVNEELETGTFIGNIAAESNLGSENGYKFQIAEDSEGLVSLNQTTGELRTAKVIDREDTCKNLRDCDIKYDVVTNKGSDVFSIFVTLQILDINDNTPTFDPVKKLLNLSEALPVDTTLPLKSAVDLDKGENNGVSNYSFSPYSAANENFELTTDNTLGLNIKLVKKLDRETQDKYQLLILAKDNGVPVRTGTLTVDISVTDENDNKPEFQDSILNVTVTEDIAVGKTIVTLQAVDEDAGKNGEVMYKLAEQQENYIFDHFAVDEISGALSVAQKLEYEPDNEHKTIYVVASDKSSTPMSSTATVFLTIKDNGNKAPQINLIFLVTKLSPNVIEVSESAEIDTAIVSVKVSDFDSGTNGQVTCNLYNTYFGLSSTLNNNDYKIFVQHELDRETTTEHNVTVWCDDGGGLRSEETFLVEVKDENDNSPIFETYIYNKDFQENNTYGAEVLTVSATDKDSGDNGRVSYYIHPDNAKEFEAEANTGVIRAKVSLDREKYGQKIFKVIAMDSGKSQRSSTATVQLDIIDINDMKPVFRQNLYEFRISEGLESNTLVDSVTAIDEDQGINNKVEYFMPDEYKSNGKYAVPFDVLQSGEIKTTAELDREAKSMYNFEVGVRDFGVPSLNNTVRVVVKVDDKNDNAPEFVFPSGANNSITAFNEVSDTEIATIEGMDLDDGINKNLIYFIVEGNEQEIFSLDPNSGKLYIVKYVHLTEDKLYTLQISVYDKGKPPLQARETLKVTLQYSNATQMHGIDESTKTNYVIIVVTVVCITCLASITIITVICLIRRKDIHKCGGKANGNIAHANMYAQGSKGLSSSQQIGNDRIYPDSLQAKNKKEVSFSIDDADSFSSSDFKHLTPKDKTLFPSRQTTLHDMPEEIEKINQPTSILRQYGQIPSHKYMDHTDNTMIVNHQREDSHSETSAETTTSHDSGKGGSVEGDNHELQLQFNTLNPSTYLIKDGRQNQSSYRLPPTKSSSSSSPVKNVPPKTLALSHKTTDLHKPSVAFNDNMKDSGYPGHRNNRTRNWCQNLDSTGSYPDSDYISLSSNPNYSQGQITPYHDQTYNHYNTSNSNQLKLSNPHMGVMNPGYGNYYPTFRSNSTRDDDETTTTSGSYTINHEDIDDDVAATQYQVSQVV
ncbi:Protocadherin-10 [Mactra antiquata]